MGTFEVQNKIRSELKMEWNDLDFMIPYAKFRYDEDVNDITYYEAEFKKLCDYITEEQIDNLMEAIMEEANERISTFVMNRVAEMEADDD